ncbi:MAG: prkC [Thermoleophilia bacterium]|nr:prkC [Thermoleophilia bacterium]
MTTLGLIDSVMCDRYRIEQLLGTGGMASVYLAHDNMLDRRVAVKVLHSRFAGDEKFVHRFEREATAVASLNHPNIVQVYDRGQHDGQYFIVMELIDGPTLKEVVEAEGPMPEDRALDLIEHAARGLAHAHQHGVVHRDVKPHNILLDQAGRVKVADFGIARAAAHAGHTITELGSIVGTAQYLSPEQAHGEQVTPASDVYSLGIVLYEMLTGQLPFDGERPLDIAFQHVNDQPIPPRAVRQDISPDVEAIILRALSKAPVERYATAAEFAQAISHHGHDADTAATLLLPAAALERTIAITHAAQTAVTHGTQQARSRWQRLSRRVQLVAIATLSAIAASAMFTLLAQANDIAAPRVEQLTQAEATRVLTDSGLRVGKLERRFSQEAPGIILDQRPGPGDGIERGTAVALVVSRGARSTQAPDVSGRTLDEARAAARAAKFEFVVIGTRHHPSAPQDTIIEQEPAASTQLPPGSALNVVISAGPPPQAEEDVDDDEGKKGKGKDKHEKDD